MFPHLPHPPPCFSVCTFVRIANPLPVCVLVRIHSVLRGSVFFFPPFFSFFILFPSAISLCVLRLAAHPPLPSRTHKHMHRNTNANAHARTHTHTHTHTTHQHKRDNEKSRRTSFPSSRPLSFLFLLLTVWFQAVLASQKKTPPKKNQHTKKPKTNKKTKKQYKNNKKIQKNQIKTSKKNQKKTPTHLPLPFSFPPPKPKHKKSN